VLNKRSLASGGKSQRALQEKQKRNTGTRERSVHARGSREGVNQGFFFLGTFFFLCTGPCLAASKGSGAVRFGRS